MPMTRQEIRDRVGTDSHELISLVLDCVRAAEADEREACAQICENEKLQADDWVPDHYPGKHFAWAIRTRGDV